MYYGLDISKLPQITNFYCITRDTVWQITEKSNILIFISSGTCEIICDGKFYTLKKDDFFFVPANHSYTRRPVNDEKCTMTYIHFNLDFAPEEYIYESLHEKLIATKTELNSDILQGESNIKNHNFVYLESKGIIQNTDKINNLLKELNVYYFNKSITSGLDCSVALCGILTLISQYTVKKCLSNSALKTAPSIPKNLKRAISYIMQNYSSPITLDDLSDFCNVSKQQLIRYFKSELSTTPNKYITEYKISRAKDLLFNYPHLSIGEISGELGFDNQHYFSKVFAKSTGETPTHYRYRTLNFGKIEKGNE